MSCRLLLCGMVVNKAAPKAAGADSSQCNFTIRQNPPIQQNQCNVDVTMVNSLQSALVDRVATDGGHDVARSHAAKLR